MNNNIMMRIIRIWMQHLKEHRINRLNPNLLACNSHTLRIYSNNNNWCDSPSICNNRCNSKCNKYSKCSRYLSRINHIQICFHTINKCYLNNYNNTNNTNNNLSHKCIHRHLSSIINMQRTNENKKVNRIRT